MTESPLHRSVGELFRRRPTLAVELLPSLGANVPAHRRVRLYPADLHETSPSLLGADAVVTLYQGKTPVLGVVVEVQLDRDLARTRRWLGYLADLHQHLDGCPVTLLVVCPRSLADWCANRIPYGHPDLALTPLVFALDQAPVVNDPADATRNPERAVLSAMGHGDHPDRERIFQAARAALRTVDRDHADLYADAIRSVLRQELPEAVGQVEDMLNDDSFDFHSDWARRRLRDQFTLGEAEGIARGEADGMAKGIAVGEAKGLTEAVLAVLGERRLRMGGDARARITQCTDVDQLTVWVHRAATAESVDDLFDGPPAGRKRPAAGRVARTAR